VGKQAFSIGSFRRQSDNVEVGLYGASMCAALTVILINDRVVAAAIVKHCTIKGMVAADAAGVKHMVHWCHSSACSLIFFTACVLGNLMSQ
jgi:hypothetical protein